MGADSYRQAVEVAKEHILAGDIFEVIVAQRFDLDLDAHPFDVYRVLRQVNPSPYMYFVRQPGVTLVGSSPEPLVQLLDGAVISRPIAGTRRRGRTEEEDRRMAAELIEHPKEIAEHIMLVDLARNDVGRVVEYGSVSVDEMMTLERYSHVMHMTSQVSGRLAAGRSAIDVLRATLPAGTVSGAPKVRAMEIIDALEPTKRGPYAGVVGYLDFSGNIDTAIAIRTLVVARRRPGLDPGRGRHRGGQRARARGPRVPQQGPGAARRHPRRSAHDRPPPHPRGRHRRRPLDSVTAMAHGVDLRTTLGAAPIQRDVVRVEGPEAIEFLQGQLSQDVAALALDRSAPSLLLQPTGKVVAWLRITRVDGRRRPARRRRGLRRGRARPSLPLQAADQGRPVARAMVRPGLAGPRRGGGRRAEWRAARPWPAGRGWRASTSCRAASSRSPASRSSTPPRCEALRIECGVPANGAELTEATIPAEAGQWLIDASVSFTKGCYTGQELVARIDSRGGNVPRPLRGLVVDGEPVVRGQRRSGTATSRWAP